MGCSGWCANKQYHLREQVLWKIMVSPRVRRLATAIAKSHLRRQVADPALRERLTPTWQLGCKRILISNDWYPAVSAPNVEVASGGVAEVRANTVVTTDGSEHPADVIIFGTGFHVADPPIAELCAAATAGPWPRAGTAGRTPTSASP